MRDQQLKDVAAEALTFYDLGSQKISASSAVKTAVEGRGLNSEQVARVCTMVNRDIFRKEKTSHGAGALWKSRWSTAKPDEVLGKTSSPYAKWEPATKGETTKQSHLRDKWEISYRDVEDVYEPEEPFSTKVSSILESPQDSLARMYSARQDAKDALSVAEARVTGLELEVASLTDDLVAKASSVKSSNGLTTAETLAVLQIVAEEDSASLCSKTSALLTQHLVEQEGLPVEAYLGTLRDDRGDLVHEKISAAKRDSVVRDVFMHATHSILSDSSLYPIRNTMGSLSAKTSELELCRAALDKLTQDVEFMNSILEDVDG